MLLDLKFQPLQQRRLESRLVMLYKIIRGMVPEINADEVFIPIRNKRQIRAKTHQDCYSTNFVNRYALNNSECYKVPASKTDQFKNSFFVKTTSDWNSLSDINIRADRWSISIGVSLHLHTDGDRSYRHLCRNINQSRFEGVEFTNVPTDQ